MTAYSIIQYHQSATLFTNSDATKDAAATYLGSAFTLSKWAEITQICVMIISTIVFVFFAYKLYLEFGWHIYKKIGADLAMRGEYQHF
jgi:CBS domain containing-hemolysin-like protein